MVCEDRGLTAIDIIVDRLPSKYKRIVMILNYFITLVINVFLVIWGFNFAMNAWIRKSPSLKIPYFYYDISIPLAFIILSGYTLKFLIKTIKGEEI